MRGRMWAVLVGLGSASAWADEPGPAWLVAKVHADWCAGCVAFGPVDAMVPPVDPACGVRVATWDVTREASARVAGARAAAIGLADVFAVERLRTGVVLLVDLRASEVVQRWAAPDGADAVRAALTRRFADCRPTDPPT